MRNKMLTLCALIFTTAFVASAHADDLRCASLNPHGDLVILDLAGGSVYLDSRDPTNHYKIVSPATKDDSRFMSVYCPLSPNGDPCAEDKFSASHPGMLVISELANQQIQVFTQSEDRWDQGGGLQFSYTADCSKTAGN